MAVYVEHVKLSRIIDSFPLCDAHAPNQTQPKVEEKFFFFLIKAALSCVLAPLERRVASVFRDSIKVKASMLMISTESNLFFRRGSV